MINQKEDTANYLGTTLFVVLFFLLISSFSYNSANQTYDPLRYELKSEFHSNNATAVIVNAILLPSFQKSYVPILYNATYNLFNANHKIFADNRKTDQNNILLQITQLSIKPILLFRFCFHLVPNDTEELPDLS
jgi:hypothetical protein